ncbi:hypothetical protein [Thermomonospora amylolytica]|uniref:hypothetical protein n=1 Tax=Thermomonospora amylolytica TaxID=1411117 RepID=UPI000E6B98CF|nr:hypothetical protein [Thermomonospora amylolytica]
MPFWLPGLLFAASMAVFTALWPLRPVPLWSIASLPPVSAVLGVAGLAVFTLAAAMSRRRSPAVA